MSGGATLARIGILLEVAHLAWLSALALFDAGRLAADWDQKALAVSVAALPLIPAVIGRSGRTTPLAIAAVGAVVLAFGLFSVATLPLIVPGVIYAVAAAMGPGGRVS